MNDAEKTKAEDIPTEEEIMSYLYTKSLTCPVCGKTFLSWLVRRSKLRQTKVDMDFRTSYKVINPSLYDVTLCNFCGYAALSNYFDRITPKQQDLIKEKITPEYKHVEHEVPLSPKDALARYKQALACAQAINAKVSQKAIICLRMAWIYREANDEKNELALIKIAYSGLKEAFISENFPLGNMDEPTAKYMIAELGRRLGEFDDALRLISDVVVAQGIPGTIKERAKELKELVREKNSSLI